MTARPHDALFKAAFGSPADAAGLFQSVLPLELVDRIRWDAIEREEGSFVDPDLADRHTDLLFSAPLRDRDEDLLLYLLIEHQSGVDPDMPLRMLGYEVRIWERHRPLPRPLILPIVLAHAVGGWTAPVQFDAQFNPHPSELGIIDLVPRFNITIVDLAQRTDEEIMEWSLGVFQKLALWLLRDARDQGRFQEALPRWRLLLAEAHAEALRARHGMQAFAKLMRYIWHVVGDLRFTEFRARLIEHLPEAKESVMTIAEELLEEGREQGREQGRLLAAAAILRRQLTLKLGALDPETDQLITAATYEQIERYLARLVTASTLAEIFED